MPHPRAPSQATRRVASRCVPVLASLLLLGCRASDGLPNVMYLGMEVNPDEKIDANLRTDTRQRLGQLEDGYRQLHPNTRFQVSLYPEKQLAWVIQHRNRAGLGPDLLLLNGDTAVRLLKAGVIAPYPQTGVDLNQFGPQVLNRLRTPPETWPGCHFWCKPSWPASTAGDCPPHQPPWSSCLTRVPRGIPWASRWRPTTSSGQSAALVRSTPSIQPQPAGNPAGPSSRRSSVGSPGCKTPTANSALPSTPASPQRKRNSRRAASTGSPAAARPYRGCARPWGMGSVLRPCLAARG